MEILNMIKILPVIIFMFSPENGLTFKRISNIFAIHVPKYEVVESRRNHLSIF